MNRTYAALSREIGESSDIPLKLLEVLASKKGSQTFPRNDEFKASLATFDLYSSRLAKYTLAMLEKKIGPGETVELSEQITIEHIMPQTLTPEWRLELGKGYEQVHTQWLHTIGNLTLSGNNQALSNESFSFKQKIYRDSNVWISRELIAKSTDTWMEANIRERAEKLAEAAVKIWHLPEEFNRDASEDEIDYSLEYSFTDYVKVTGEKPRSVIFGGEEKSVDSWASMFVDVLKILCNFDPAIYEKLMQHDVFVRCNLAVPKSNEHAFRTKNPVEVYPGYMTELHWSSKDLMSFMQIAIEFYELQDEFLYTLKRKA